MDQTTPNNSSTKIVAGIVVIVVIALIAYSYIQNSQSKALDTQIEQKQAEIAGSDAQVQVLKQQGTDTSPSSIQADLNATNIDAIDAQ